jgi:hypothetical protein
MHSALLHTHNLLRWAVLILGVIAFVKALQGMKGDRPYGPARGAGLLYTASLHLQLLLGLLLYMVSPAVKAIMRDMQAAMGDSGMRFIVVEHPTIMVVATILMTIGGIIAKNAANDASKHRKAAIFIGITMGMVLWGIPWQRALFPGM